MSSCAECHGMAGEEYDDHDSNHCPRIEAAPSGGEQPETDEPSLILRNLESDIVKSLEAGTDFSAFISAFARAKAAINAHSRRQTEQALTRIQTEMRMHTVPEGTGLITRSYLDRTIEFELKRMREASS